jgi:hypothetical protein
MCSEDEFKVFPLLPSRSPHIDRTCRFFSRADLRSHRSFTGPSSPPRFARGQATSAPSSPSPPQWSHLSTTLWTAPGQPMQPSLPTSLDRTWGQDTEWSSPGYRRAPHGSIPLGGNPYRGNGGSSSSPDPRTWDKGRSALAPGSTSTAKSPPSATQPAYERMNATGSAVAPAKTLQADSHPAQEPAGTSQW